MARVSQCLLLALFAHAVVANRVGAPPVNEETKVVEYKSPIERVVALLKKMKSELEAEAANEAEMYDKMVLCPFMRPFGRTRS